MTAVKPFEAVIALLEVTASGNPQLVEFQLHTILNSPARSAVYSLASAFEASHQEVGQIIRRACVDLDRLERRKDSWRDPTKILGSPNLAALRYVCRARLDRVAKPERQQRLERIQHRVERAYERARSRAWIEAFIGMPVEKTPQEA